MSKMSYQHNPLKRPLDGRLWHQLLDSKAEQQPDTEVMIMYSMDMKRSAMTYAEYRDRSTYLAASLLDLGLSRGQRVLLIGQTNLRYVVFIMALHRIGANTILLGAGGLTPDKVDLLKRLNCQMIAYDQQMKESQTKQLMEGIKQLTQHNVDSKKEKQILVTLRDVGQDLNPATYHVYDYLLKRGQAQDLQKLHDAQAEVQFDDPIAAISTSGSTGEPKVVQFTTHGCVSCFSALPPSSADSPRQPYFIDRPASYGFGYISRFVVMLANMVMINVPAEMSLMEETAENVFKIWEKERCSQCPLNTALIQKLVTESMHLKYDLSSIKVFTLIGQRYSLESLQALFAIFPSVRLIMPYGATECSIAGDMIGKECATVERFGKLTIYPGVEVKIVDDENKIVPRGTTGEICARGRAVFLEYMDNPEATKQAKSPTGWFHTGDIGIMDDDGKIEVLGRKTEIIKRATLKIFPAEIEKVLSQHPNVEDVVVVGIPDQRLHEEICACVVLREDAENVSRDEKAKLQELEDWCKEQWPPGPDGLSLKPKYFLAIKRIPMMTTGKTSRREMKAEAIKQFGVL